MAIIPAATQRRLDVRLIHIGRPWPWANTISPQGDEPGALRTGRRGDKLVASPAAFTSAGALLYSEANQ